MLKIIRTTVLFIFVKPTFKTVGIYNYFFRFFISVISLDFKIFKNYYNYLIKENKFGGSCRINGSDRKYIHNFCLKT